MTTALQKFLDKTGLYRSMSRVPDAPASEKTKALKMDEEACKFFVENMTPEVLYEISERMGSHIPPGHPDNQILFAIRQGISARNKEKRKNAKNSVTVK